MMFDLGHDNNQLVIYVLTLMKIFELVRLMMSSMMMMLMMKEKKRLLLYDDLHLNVMTMVLSPLRRIYDYLL
jgi:hypothetical protein